MLKGIQGRERKVQYSLVPFHVKFNIIQECFIVKILPNNKNLTKT